MNNKALTVQHDKCLSEKEIAAFRRILRDGISYIPHVDIDAGKEFPDIFAYRKPPVANWACHFTNDVIGTHLPKVRKTDLLTPEEEKAAFLYYNCIRRKAHQVYKKFLASKEAVSAGEVRELIAMVEQTDRIRDAIIAFNIGLVAHSAIFFIRKHPKFDINDICSEGFWAMIRVVECFDIGRGNKFSTYATISLFNAYKKVLDTAVRSSKRQIDFTSFSYDHAQDFGNRIGGTGFVPLENPELKEVLRVIKDNELGLSETEIGVITLKYFTRHQAEDRELTWAEIGRTLEIPREAARDLHAQVCEKLRKHMNGDDN